MLTNRPPTHPGLNIARIRPHTRARHNTHQLLDRIAAHLDQSDGYVAFSGGKDSLTVLHLALQAEPNAPVVFFDSGLEFPETLTYLQQIAEYLRIPAGIHTIPATPSLLNILIDAGTWHRDRPDTPTGSSHLIGTLIQQPASIAHALYGPGELWGVRATESASRRTLYNAALAQPCTCCSSREERRTRHGGTITRKNGTTAYSPVWDWTTDDVLNHAARHHLPLNPIYRKLAELGAPANTHRVTQILTGSHLTYGRASWLKQGWPAIYNALASVLPRLTDFA